MSSPSSVSPLLSEQCLQLSQHAAQAAFSLPLLMNAVSNAEVMVSTAAALCLLHCVRYTVLAA